VSDTTENNIVQKLVLQNRSCRRFHQEAAIPEEQLRRWVDLARLSPSGANRQPLKFILSCQPGKNDKIFPCLHWAAYLKDWGGPAEGEKPSAYIIILCDQQVAQSPGCDHGIAAQSIMLGAVAEGWGGCMLGSVNRGELMAALGIPEAFEILLVLALGKPRETVVIEPVTGGRTPYWRDAQGVHHVPKRALDELILKL
jgi:nitroreductase